MNREKELAKNTLIITIGRICTQMITFFLLPLYTTILTTEEYGIVDLLNSLVMFLIPIISLQLEQAVFRKLIDNRKNNNQIKKIISSTFLFILSSLILYICIFSFFSIFIENQYKYFLLSNVIIILIANVLLQIIRGLGNNKGYSVASFISATVTVILNVVLVALLKWGAYGMLLATFIGNLSSIVYLCFKIKIVRFIDLKEARKSLIIEMIKYSFPLIPNAISWWIFDSSDRIIVSTFLGVSQNGILSASYKFSNVFIVIYNIFNMTWTESAALHISDEDKDEFFSNIINKALKFFIPLAYIIIAVMPIIFPIMINNKFQEAYNHIFILLISSIFNVIAGLLSVIYIAKKETKKIAKSSMLAALINLIINIFLIRYIGLFAASISTLVSYFVLMIYRIIDVKKYIKLNYDYKFISKMILFGIILLFTYYIKNLMLTIAVIILCMCMFLKYNKENIQSIFMSIKVFLNKKGGRT